MDEKTRFYDGETPGEENQEYRDETFEEQPEMEQEHTGSGKKFIRTGAAVAIGIGAGVLGTHLAFGKVPGVEIPGLGKEEDSGVNPEDYGYSELKVSGDLQIAQNVEQNMSYEEAYAAAREEIGAGGIFVWHGNVYGTYQEEEWSALDNETQEEYLSNFTIEDNNPGASDASMLVTDAELASGVNDDMTFGEAFAAARNEVGEGGVFVWHGEAYNTYYKEEWSAMADADKQDFLDAYIDIPDEQLAALINDSAAEEEPETFSEEELLAAEPVPGDTEMVDDEEAYMATVADNATQQEPETNLNQEEAYVPEVDPTQNLENEASIDSDLTDASNQDYYEGLPETGEEPYVGAETIDAETLAQQGGQNIDKMDVIIEGAQKTSDYMREHSGDILGDGAVNTIDQIGGAVDVIKGGKDVLDFLKGDDSGFNLF